MFSKFFYTLKDKGLEVSLSEWLTLQDALQQGLCHSSLTEFYYLARMILVKSETEFDKFDMAFDEVFKGVQSENEVSKNMLRWLDKPEMQDVFEEMRHEMNQEVVTMDKDDIENKFKDRLRDQDEEHNGGSFWIGTMGKTSFGNMGGNMGGIRVGGSTGYLLFRWWEPESTGISETIRCWITGSSRWRCGNCGSFPRNLISRRRSWISMGR